MSAVERVMQAAEDQRGTRAISSSVMGMAIFVASEAIFFAAFFGVYASSFASESVWPPKQIPLPGLVIPTADVIVLVLSGLFLTGALATLRRGAERTTVLWLAAATAGALGFLALLLAGYAGVGFGIKDGIYASLFYVVTGLEVAHAVGGVVLFGTVFVRAANGELALRHDPVQAAALYWYFVIALGIVVFLIFYLGATL